MVLGSTNIDHKCKQQFKNEVATEIAATLAFSATQNNDKIGLILFSDKVELYIPPKKGRSHVLRIIRELIEFEPESKQTNIAEALKFMQNVMKKKAIVFVLSDFIADDYHQTMKIASFSYGQFCHTMPRFLKCLP